MSVPMMSVLDAYLGGCALLENVEETPPGANDGPIVHLIQATTGNNKPDPWCASSKAYVGDRILGARWPLPKTASCNALALFAIAHGVFRCTATVYADLQKHGLNDAGGKSAIAAANVAQSIGAAGDIIAAPQRGDVCLLYSMTLHHFHHAGAVRELLSDGLQFGTWEGNTTKPGQVGNEREGWGYFKKQHALTDPWGWVRWIDLMDLHDRVSGTFTSGV